MNTFTFIYFLSIGVAFMFMEMGIVQKFVLFLGHPIYSMAVVVPTILIFSGLGSLSSHRLKVDGLTVCMATCLCGSLMFLIRYLIPHISNLFLLQPMPIRVAAVIVTIAPLAFCMGFPFPLALKVISTYSREMIPWAWAINGSFSVMASIVAVIIAMEIGFKTVLNTGAIFYMVAALSSLLLIKKAISLS